MTKLQTALSTAGLMLALGASTVPALALPAADANACPVKDAPAKAVTSYNADWPAALPPMETTHGTAMVQIHLADDGTPGDAMIVKSTGFALLDRNAKEAALSQVFTPEIRDCKPVAGTYLYEVDY